MVLAFPHTQEDVDHQRRISNPNSESVFNIEEETKETKETKEVKEEETEEEETEEPENDDPSCAFKGDRFMPLTECDLHERFEDFLDEVHEDIKVCGYTYSPSQALKDLDPIAFDQEYSYWLSNEVDGGYIMYDSQGNHYWDCEA